jgi:replicative DNA helicase
MGDLRPIDTQTEAPPLVSYETEQALLAGLLFNNDAYPAIATALRPDDFADPLHGRIFEAMGELIADGRKADHVTLFRQFAADQALNQSAIPAERRGGKYIAELARCVVVAKPEYLADYARGIADLSKRRRLNAVLTDIAERNARSLQADFSAADLVSAIETELWVARGDLPGDSNIVSVGRLVETVLQQAEASYKGGSKVRGITTGLTRLDAILNGLCPGDFTILAARPGMGKTACMNSIARSIAGTGKRVGIESIEMSGEQLTLRSLAGESGVNTTRVRAGTVTEDDMDRLIRAGDGLRGLPIDIAATTAPTVQDIANRWITYQRRYGLDVLMVDYLQLVKPSDKRIGRYEEVTAVSNGLKALAKQLGVPVVALAQLSREVEKRDNKRPLMSDLRESGAIEQDADQIVFLYRHQYYLEKEEPQKRPGEDPNKFSKRSLDWQAELDACTGQAELIVAKNRHGMTGTAKVRFDAERQRFEDMDARGGTVPPASDDPNDQWWAQQ